jgi:Asp-tRNA(Asn)/Glu-tRNA(Gln) amidotransferase A subunit family amidase
LNWCIRFRSPHDVTDAEYTAARAGRAAIAHAVLTALQRYDVLLAPASAILAPPRDRADMRVPLLSCVVPFSQAPVPVVTTPLPGPGLPIGAQLVGRPGDDEALLAFSERVRRP